MHKEIINNRLIKRTIYVIIIIAFAILASYRFVSVSESSGNADGFFHLRRIISLAESIKNNVFLQRLDWTSHNGYGLITPIMYPQTFLYIPSIIYLITNNYALAFNIFIIFINILTGLIAYYSVLKIFNDDKHALIAAILWLFSPYRLTDLYIRTAVGEILAAAFLPFFILSLYYLLIDDYNRWPVFVIASTCIFRSHILSTLFCVIIFIIFFIINIRLLNRNRLFALIKGCVFTLLINLNVLIPLIDLMLRFDMNMPFVTNIGDMALSFNDIIVNGIVNYSINIKFIVLLLISTIYILTVKDIKNSINITILIEAIIFFILTTKLIPYNNIYEMKIGVINKFLDSLQFPWRLSMVSSVFISIIAPIAILSAIRTIFNHRFYFVGQICFIIFIASIFMNYVNHDIWYGYTYISYESFGNVDYTPAKAKFLFLDDYDAKCIYNGDVIDVDGINREYYQYEFDYKLKNEHEEATIILPLFNYPGYKAYDDNNEIAIHENDNALIQLFTTKKNGHIKVKYEVKNIWKLCSVLSLSAFILFLINLLFTRHYFKKLKK